MLSFASASISLMPATVPARAPAPMMAAERSASIPFLKKPPALDGSMIGDMGFDPLGFSTTITELGGDLGYAREAELMHGRQAMLATVGMVFPKVFGKLPAPWTEGVSTNPLEAQFQLPPVVLGQIAFSIFIAEALRSRIVYSGDANYVVGDHGFGSKFLNGKTDAQVKDMKLKELNNGRLAMIAVTGMFFQISVKGNLWPIIDGF